jgi:hypothetical protein
MSRLRDTLEMLGLETPIDATEQELQAMLDSLNAPLADVGEAYDDPDDVVKRAGEALKAVKFVTSIDEAECFGVSWQADDGVCPEMQCMVREACNKTWLDNVDRADSLPEAEPGDPDDQIETTEKLELVSEPIESGSGEVGNLAGINEADDASNDLVLHRAKYVPIEYVGERSEMFKPESENKFTGRRPLSKEAVKTAYSHLTVTLQDNEAISGVDLIEDLRYHYPEEEVWHRPNILKNLHRSIRVEYPKQIGITNGYYHIREREV